MEVICMKNQTETNVNEKIVGGGKMVQGKDCRDGRTDRRCMDIKTNI